jgi:uncharacterized damage-inducible protein DinB
MQTQFQSTLEVIYENWRVHHERLRGSLEGLTVEQLRLQPAAGMWPLGQIAQHIISTRAGWFSGTLQDEDEAMRAYMDWGEPDSPERSGEELALALDETFSFIESRVRRWTSEERAVTFPDEWDGQVYYVSRSWVIYHVLEHDVHHGGEISLVLGMHGLPVPDI